MLSFISRVAFGVVGYVLLVIGCAFVYNGSARAAEPTIDVSITSWHSSEKGYWDRTEKVRRPFNNENFGMGVTIPTAYDSVAVRLGFYDSSYHKWSTYAGIRLGKVWAFGPVELNPGVTVGVVTGYKDTPMHAHEFQRMAHPDVRFMFSKTAGFSLGYIPSRLVHKDAVNVKTLQAHIAW